MELGRTQKPIVNLLYAVGKVHPEKFISTSGIRYGTGMKYSRNALYKSLYRLREREIVESRGMAEVDWRLSPLALDHMKEHHPHGVK